MKRLLAFAALAAVIAIPIGAAAATDRRGNEVPVFATPTPENPGGRWTGGWKDTPERVEPTPTRIPGGPPTGGWK